MKDNDFKFSNFDFQNKRQYHEDSKINSFAKPLLPDKEWKHGGVFKVEPAFFLLLLVSIGQCSAWRTNIQNKGANWYSTNSVSFV